ncbi:MAG: DUF6456 domain-containing protein [Rhodobacteraceae bacterium]|nr:DUF6456 domain-containing protein [Paracoccaceae bacterium]
MAGKAGTPGLPDWVPEPARAYVEHTRLGRSMRALARDLDGHASTVSRHIRRLETRRDDPLVDAALARLEQHLSPSEQPNEGYCTMFHTPITQRLAADPEVEKEARRILRRLCESGAFLIVGSGLERGAVMRETDADAPVRTAIVDRPVVEAFALKDWIECYRKGQISRYRITEAGRAALKRLLADETQARQSTGFAEAQSPFLEQHKEWDTREVADGQGKRRALRYNLAESPLGALARRKGSDGKPFLSRDMLLAGERLREDFEMAQMGARVTQNWDRFLTTGRSGGFSDGGMAEGPRAARERVAQALKDLGPGLGDIALRCCCFLEGLETAEKRMGWSARSGKIVLRIALQRLKVHYENGPTGLSPKIG